jgi:arsenite methyltransferase
MVFLQQSHHRIPYLFSKLACIMKIIFGLSLVASSSAFFISPPSTTTTTTTTRLFVATTNDKALFVDETRASVSNYYGKELSSSDDLKTNACCTAGSPPKYIQDCINNIHPEVVSKYYGCGLCLPQYPLEGAKILGTDIR